MRKHVLIRWKVRGCLNVDGKSHARIAGEEDVVRFGHAQALSACGLVKIIGDADSVPVVTEIVDDTEEGSEGLNSGSTDRTEAV